jgi:NIPSNAP
MVIDFRAYTLKVGAVQTFLELFEQEGLEPQRRILGNFMGLYRTEIGVNINQIIMMFGYADAGERERRRAALYKDPAFAAYLKKARELITAQEVRLLVAAACNPRIEGVEL